MTFELIDLLGVFIDGLLTGALAGYIIGRRPQKPQENDFSLGTGNPPKSSTSITPELEAALKAPLWEYIIATPGDEKSLMTVASILQTLKKKARVVKVIGLENTDLTDLQKTLRRAGVKVKSTVEYSRPVLMVEEKK